MKPARWQPRQYLADTARAYSALFFLDSPAAGALLLASTFAYPNIGASGLLAALVGLATARLFRFPAAPPFLSSTVCWSACRWVPSTSWVRTWPS